MKDDGMIGKWDDVMEDWDSISLFYSKCLLGFLFVFRTVLWALGNAGKGWKYILKDAIRLINREH